MTQVPQRVAIGDVATIERGIVEAARIKTGSLYIGLENIESGGRLINVHSVANGDLASSKFAFTSQHVLFGKLRPYLAKIARPDFEGICSTDILPILPGPKLDRRYLAWFLLTPHIVSLAASRAAGANLPRLRPKALAQLQIPLPPLPEQRRIADTLDKADALRAKRRAAIAKLDELTQSIFLDMFGDSIANPKSWPMQKLGSLLSFQQYGPRFYNEAYSEDGIRIVRISDLNESGTLRFSNMPRMLVSAEDEAKYNLHAGDLIFARTGATVGKVALINPGDPPCIAGAYFIVMRFDRGTVAPGYALAVLMAPSVRAIVARRSRQAAQQNFSGPALRALPMPLPPIELQEEFTRRIDAIKRLKTSHDTALVELGTLFASLQQRAFCGAL